MPTSIPCRRFGRSEIEIPILSLGGMRYQQSWSDLALDEISFNEQSHVENILEAAVSCGLHHVETARHYGSSELQLGRAMQKISDSKRLLQTKVPANDDPHSFEKELELSFERLKCKRVDLFAIHGLNLPEHLDQTLRPNGCMDVVRRWQDDGRIGHVGFSTHGPVDLIIEAIKTGHFDYVNLHWYYIWQENSLALDVAKEYDLGVFIISPTDKGGHLHNPSLELIKLCAPLHPIVFNDLFCLSDPRVHTISVGVANLQDFEKHLEAVTLLDSVQNYLPEIKARLYSAARMKLGDAWLDSWKVGLPSWQETPGHINLHVLLWLHNLLEAWDMESYAKARYCLLGNGGHWFPGSNADVLDSEVSEISLREALCNSPWRDDIPLLLRNLRERIGGQSRQRLSSA
ncbi:aldo/keto reductase [Prochlorococcus sp. MIT 1300]|uniref:aldo/keto reductase n=1 Tax=Prochlorococcus sp. MIT 1300 TaxID=3096218 RepID=UPI002A74E4EE|nr:aldo/keto reductase [Prochlorococcus sp. MIT 1300]